MTEQHANESQLVLDADEFDKDKIYKFDGVTFVEIPRNEDVVKVPVTMEANEVVRDVRSRVARILKRRPEIDIVASALLMLAARYDDEKLAETVRDYGFRMYQPKSK